MIEIEARDMQELIRKLYAEQLSFPVRVQVKQDVKPRTPTQNKAIHLYCSMVATDLNAMGLTVSEVMEVIGKLGEIPWNETLAKEFLWRRFQKAITGVESSADLNTAQVDQVYQNLSMNLAKLTGISTPFPSRHG